MFRTMNPDEIDVLVPVPADRVLDVIAYLNQLATGVPVTTAPTADTGVTIEVPGQGPWTQAQIAWLADRLSYTGVITLFDLCAAAPDTWVAKFTAETTAGISPIQLRNELAALSKLVIREMQRKHWPIEWKKDGTTYYYRFDPTIAAWWNEARATVTS